MRNSSTMEYPSEYAEYILFEWNKEKESFKDDNIVCMFSATELLYGHKRALDKIIVSYDNGTFLDFSEDT